MAGTAAGSVGDEWLDSHAAVNGVLLICLALVMALVAKQFVDRARSRTSQHAAVGIVLGVSTGALLFSPLWADVGLSGPLAHYILQIDNSVRFYSHHTRLCFCGIA